MRKRYPLSAMAALILAAGGGAVAYADPFGAEAAERPSAETGSRSVTLPTGDVVTVKPGGGVDVTPADEDRDVGFVAPRSADGSRDVVVIPSDKLSDLVVGKADPRRYNVSALLRSGQPDAAEADLSAMDAKTYGQFTPIDPGKSKADADVQPVDLTFTDHTGKQATDLTANYVNVDTGAIGEFTVASDGTASADLPPGEYDVLSSLYGTDKANVVATTPVTVADEPVKTTVDGTKAVKVDARVDAATTRPLDQNIEVYSQASNGSKGSVSILSQGSENADMYAIPVDAGQHSRREFTYRTTRAPKESTDSLYNLAFNESSGIPADLDYTVDPDELASITTKYHSLGGEQSGYTSSCAVYAWQTFVLCEMIDTEFPSERTQYYSTGDEIDWANDAEYEGESGDDFITVERALERYQPGPGDRQVGDGPFGTHLNGGSILRGDDEIFVNVSHSENPAADENVYGAAVTGSMKLSKDGEVIGEADEPFGGVTVPKGDSGRYTLSVDAETETDVTALGTKGSAEWEFASEPTDDYTPIDLSSVVFDAENIDNATAPADAAQPFTLDYLPQDGAAEADAEKITFEVSYDDGKSWKEVDVDLEGNTATGTLEHPADAEYVSYRTAASDESGNTFRATAIRSYALN